MTAESEEPEGERLQTPEVALRKALDRHGYGFHYAVMKHIQDLPTSYFSVEAAEFPVSFRGGTTHIDLVLRHKRHAGWRIVAECKRLNPAYVDWCFVRTPRVDGSVFAGGNEPLAFDHIRVSGAGALVSNGGHLLTDRLFTSDRVFGLGLPVKRDARGDSVGEDPKRALDQAVAQVFRGSNGLLEFLALHQEEYLQIAGDRWLGCLFPVVFTNARLWVSAVDLTASDLAEGKVPPASLERTSWLWFQQYISPDLMHTLPLEGAPAIESYPSLTTFADGTYLHAIAIVGADGIDEFLRWRQFHL